MPAHSPSRRQFVGGGLAALLAAPFVAQLAAPRGARAQGRSGARRLVVVFTPNGTVHRHWRPVQRGSDFEFAPGSILEPLAPVRRDLVVVDGVDYVGVSNHEGGMAAMLTGGAGGATGGASIDQYVAAALGGSDRFPSLEIGVQTSAWGGSVQTRMSYRRAGEMVPPEDDPRALYRRLFGEARQAGGDPATPDRALLRRRSVIDAVRRELRALSSKLPAEERPKLDAHLTSLRQMETSLSTDPGVGREGCPPGAPALTGHLGNDDFPAVGKAQTDLLVAALACGQTRVASLQWAHTIAPQVFSWTGTGEGHHALSHMADENAAGVRQFVDAERWFSEQMLYLIEKLKELPEPGGDGSLFDHTLVVWAKEMGDSRLHDCFSVPWVLTGGASGGLRRGRYVRLDHAPHQKLLVSICHLMGLDNPTFGDPSHGTGPLAEVVG
jgi:hypothetical protein